MARPTKKRKSTIAAAVVQVRTALGESQQAFSNRLGVAIQTVARWETHRPPSGEALLHLADLANRINCKQASERLTKKYFSDLRTSIDKKSFPMRAALQHLGIVLNGVYQIIDKWPAYNEHAIEGGLQEIIRLINWPQLAPVQKVLTGLKRISDLANQPPTNGVSEKDRSTLIRLIGDHEDAINEALAGRSPDDIRYY